MPKELLLSFLFYYCTILLIFEESYETVLVIRKYRLHF